MKIAYLAFSLLCFNPLLIAADIAEKLQDQNGCPFELKGQDALVASTVSECTICCDALVDRLLEVLPCGHVLHVDCMDQWISRKVSLGENSWPCPECRRQYLCASPTPKISLPVLPDSTATDTNAIPRPSCLCRFIRWFCLDPVTAVD